MFTTMHNAVDLANRNMLAETMWPYYDNMVHKILCNDLIHHESFLVCIALFTALVIFPILVLLVEARLESDVAVHPDSPYLDADDSAKSEETKGFARHGA